MDTRERAEDRLRDELTADEFAVAFDQSYFDEAGEEEHAEWLLTADLREIRDWCASGVDELQRDRDE